MLPPAHRHAEANFNLACVTSGRQRLRHLRRVLQADPRHKLALKLLGGCRRLVVVGAEATKLLERTACVGRAHRSASSGPPASPRGASARTTRGTNR